MKGDSGIISWKILVLRFVRGIIITKLRIIILVRGGGNWSVLRGKSFLPTSTGRTLPNVIELYMYSPKQQTFYFCSFVIIIIMIVFNCYKETVIYALKGIF